MGNTPFEGIVVSRSNNIIGGNQAGAGNVVSTNGRDGISVICCGSGNVVQGNLIGTDVTGSVPMGNGGDGVEVSSSDVLIGGTEAGAGNIISNNAGDGIRVRGQGTVIQGNLIGTDVTGTVAMGNLRNGIRIRSANNIVGGITPGAGNIISANGAGQFLFDGNGITLDNRNANGNLIQSNLIGTQADGISPLGNVEHGVAIGFTTLGNILGGSEAGAGNTIAFNGGNGVTVIGLSTRRAISGNSIFSNGGIGIDLTLNLPPDGPTPNDPGDLDQGPNNLQNFPDLSSSILNSTASTTFRLEFFSNDGCDPSGFGEGRKFLGFLDVTTDETGDAIFEFQGKGSFLTATATDPDGNTSEFSQCIELAREEDPKIPRFNTTIEAPQNPSTKTAADVPHDGGLGSMMAVADPCPPPGSTSCPSSAQDVGDPLYLHSGEFYLYEVDLRIPGRGFDWTFSRKYRSGVALDGLLGHSWEFNYSRRLLLVTEGNIEFVRTIGLPTKTETGDILRMDGLSRVDLYQEQPDGSHQAPTGFYTQLVGRDDGGFMEGDYSGQLAFYGPPDAQGIANLSSLQDRDGNTMRFLYDDQNQLVGVLDTLGRSIHYFYNEDGRIIRITDFLGRTIGFTYDDNGDLVEVTSPAVTDTPNENDFPQGKTVRYTYSSGFEDERLNHNLISITAPNEVASGGPPRVVLTYNGEVESPNVDRVVSQTLGGINHTGVPAGGTITYEYQSLAHPEPPATNDPIFQTTVTDRNGNLTQYQFNQLGNIVSVLESTNRDVRDSDPEFYETRHEYNEDGRLNRTIYPEGNSVEPVSEV